MMDCEDLMPCGLCPVCHEMVDHSEAGFCHTCGSPFHWGQCGEWTNFNHKCDKCRDAEAAAPKPQGWNDIPVEPADL